MELTLARQDKTQVLVNCDGQPSHTFDLLTLVPDEKGRLNHSRARARMAKLSTRHCFHRRQQPGVS